jgi:hypothetical protein
MKILIEISEENAATAFPWWIILDPRQNMRAEAGDLASQITGPFFSRAAAQKHLVLKRHRFSDRAVVWCHSGRDSIEYVVAMKAPLSTSFELEDGGKVLRVDMDVIPGSWRATIRDGEKTIQIFEMESAVELEATVRSWHENRRIALESGEIGKTIIERFGS